VKLVRVWTSFQRICGSSACCAAIYLTAGSVSAATIDIGKPASESLTPDGVYWTFDGGTVDDWMPDMVEDKSGNGFIGKLLSGAQEQPPKYVQGKFGTAIHFDINLPKEGVDPSKNDKYPNSRVGWSSSDPDSPPDEKKLDMAEASFSGGAWVKLDAIRSGEPQIVMIFQQGMPSSWHFRLIKDAADQWKIHFNGVRSTQVTEAFNDLAWHHVGFTFEKGDTGGAVTFWLDGQPLENPVTVKDSIAPLPAEGRRLFTVGESNLGYFSEGFTGSMDDAFVTTGVHTFQ